jgi:redox-sensitive bicupin YhaK (pirin superfamily)
MKKMSKQVEKTARDAILVEDAALIRMMGMPVLEALPSRSTPYERVDPFLLVHQAQFHLSEMAGKDTRHPHRGSDNIWYVLKGSASTAHSTGPGGSTERGKAQQRLASGIEKG